MRDSLEHGEQLDGLTLIEIYIAVKADSGYITDGETMLNVARFLDTLDTEIGMLAEMN